MSCNESLSGLYGAGYRGCQNVTVNGFPCKKWSEAKVSQFPGKGLGDHNFCRNPEQAILRFKPGEMGIACDDNGNVHKVSVDGPAYSKGIRAGYEIVKVGTEPYSQDALRRAQESGIDYEVTVKVGSASGDTIYCETESGRFGHQYCTPKVPLCLHADLCCPDDFQLESIDCSNGNCTGLSPVFTPECLNCRCKVPSVQLSTGQTMSCGVFLEVALCLQIDVERFGALNCRAVGSLLIGVDAQSRHCHQTDIKSLASLQSIHQINGSLVVDSTFADNLTGLENITYVRNSVTISRNIFLTSLAGLRGVRDAWGMKLIGNDELKTLKELPDALLNLPVSRAIVSNYRMEFCKGGSKGPYGYKPCTLCELGTYSKEGARACEPCPAGRVSPGSAAKCQKCPSLQRPSWDQSFCRIWFLTPDAAEFYMVVATLLLAILLRRWVLKRRLKRRHAELALLESVVNGISTQNTEIIEEARDKLTRAYNWTSGTFLLYVQGKKKEQSENSGVSVAYMVSEEFHILARQKTGINDPDFYELKDAFFYGDAALGKDQLCPRDGLAGCALVDLLPCDARGPCTHFLSWTWGYKISLVEQTLHHWMNLTCLKPCVVFLFCCFFCNNQYRILIEGNGQGSENLEDVFEKRLRRIGRVVALLDTWNAPSYLTRVWTIYEQFTAAKLGIDVTLILPPEAHGSLIQQLGEGTVGFEAVTAALVNIDSENADAYSLDDKEKVKSVIQATIGFDAVNRAVGRVMVKWVGEAVQEHFRQLTETQTRQRFGTFVSVTEHAFSQTRFSQTRSNQKQVHRNADIELMRLRTRSSI